jgi:trehalose synthase
MRSRRAAPNDLPLFARGYARVHDVALTERHLERYTPVVGGSVIAELRSLARPVRGLRVRHVNATSYGGGVAEILHNLAPLMNDVGLDCAWSVLDADGAFFDVTKRVHNALQGMPLDLDDTQKRLFIDTQTANARELQDADVTIAHDPQAVALRSLAPERARAWAWRCHIDLTTAYQPVWSYLRPLVAGYEAAIFTLPDYVQRDLDGPRLVFSAPSIDPLSTKNADLPASEVREIVGRFDIDLERPLLVQVSRFDPWKDPAGVIDAYRIVKRAIPEVQLALVGSMADDDPEGQVLLQRTLAHAAGDRDVRILTNLDGVKDREVNAFQRAATVVLQKSLREGFGLVVAEALWKGIPVVGGAVGGIPLQIIDGETGFLVRDVAECAERTLRLLREPALRARMGEAGREHVRRNFLITRDLRDHLQLVNTLVA